MGVVVWSVCVFRFRVFFSLVAYHSQPFFFLHVKKTEMSNWEWVTRKWTHRCCMSTKMGEKRSRERKSDYPSKQNCFFTVQILFGVRGGKQNSCLQNICLFVWWCFFPLLLLLYFHRKQNETLYDMWHSKLENWKIGVETHCVLSICLGFGLFAHLFILPFFIIVALETFSNNMNEMMSSIQCCLHPRPENVKVNFTT